MRKNENGAKTKIIKTFNLPTLSSCHSMLSLEKNIKLQCVCNFPLDSNKIRHSQFPLQALNVGLEVPKVNFYDSLSLVKKTYLGEWILMFQCKQLKISIERLVSSDEIFEMEVFVDAKCDELHLPLVSNDDLEQT